MGVTNEYFIAPTDADAAKALEDGPAAGVIGPDPNTELIALEAILLGLDPDGPEAVALASRPDHAVDVAHDGDYDRMVIRIAAATTQLIGNKTLDELRARIPRWARTDEMAGAFTTDIDHMLTVLHPLFATAASERDRQLYVWISL